MQNPSTPFLVSPVFVLLAILLAGSPAKAQLVAPLDSVANVSGSITSTIGNWSDAQQSLDLDPNIQVMQVIASLNANSFVNASQNLGVDRLQVETGFSARTSGSSSDVAIAHDYTLRFSLSSPATFEFRNGNNTGGFPVAFAPDVLSTASLDYRLEEEGGPVIFNYAAPNVSNGSPGIYASGALTAGTYVFSIVGSAAAFGDPCCVFQSVSLHGNVALEFQPAPLAPGLWGGSALLLLAALVSLASVALLRHGRRFSVLGNSGTSG